MKYFLAIFFSIILCIAAKAQTDTSATNNGTGRIVFKEDFGFFGMLDRYRVVNERRIYTDGYRIQIAFTLDQAEAMKVKSEFYRTFPNMRCYMTYEQPYHKVRVGDYETQGDSKEDFRSVVRVFPGAFLVRDKVRIKKPTEQQSQY